ncbi:MAG: ADP-glyceromanno-heptose 6-epimerase [Rhodospirillales bacterium]
MNASNDSYKGLVLITGGAGFIGSVAAATLEGAGYDIAICDRLRSGDKWRNIAKRDLVDIISPDNLFDVLESNPGAFDAVVHMGAISSTTETDADLIVDTNFKLSMALWQWCAETETPLIYASSAATYGDGANGFDDDIDRAALAKLRPMNPYGWSKLLFDRRVAAMVEAGEPSPPQWAGLRFFNVYGPNEYHKGSMQSVVSHIFPSAREGATARLFESHHPDYEDGGQLRDFVWVGDCAKMIHWLVSNPSVSGLFNCGTGKARSFRELAEAVYRALDCEPEIQYVPTPEAIRNRYQYFTEADMARARAAGFDHKPTSLEDGITMYVRDYLATEDPYL